MSYHEEEAAPAGTAPSPTKRYPRGAGRAPRGSGEHHSLAIWDAINTPDLCKNSHQPHRYPRCYFTMRKGSGKVAIKDVCLKFQCKTTHGEVLILHTTPWLSRAIHLTFFVLQTLGNSSLAAGIHLNSYRVPHLRGEQACTTLSVQTELSPASLRHFDTRTQRWGFPKALSVS